MTMMPFDPGRDYSMPWQSGFGGIIYRKDLVKREPKSVDDLFDPDYKGKVTMLTEMRDTVGVVAAGLGGFAKRRHYSVVTPGETVPVAGMGDDIGFIILYRANNRTSETNRSDTGVKSLSTSRYGLPPFASGQKEAG